MYPRSKYPYERRTVSTASVPQDQGDFYYQANIFGGALEDVHRLTKTCREHLEVGTHALRQALTHSGRQTLTYLLTLSTPPSSRHSSPSSLYLPSSHPRSSPFSPPSPLISPPLFPTPSL